MWKKREVSASFCLCSSVAEPPRYISGCFKGEWGSRLWRAPCFVLILELFQFTHIGSLCAAVWSKGAEVRTYCLIPAGAALSVCRVPSLTQTAALLHSSVAHFVVAPKKVFRQLLRYSFYFLSIPKGNRSLFLFFSLSPLLDGDQWQAFFTSLLVLNERRRIPEEQEYFITVICWKFLSISAFLPLSCDGF